MKRTNVVIDETMIEKAKRATGIKTTREVLDVALRELLRHERLKEFRKLRGRVNWQGDLAQMRRGRALRA